MDNLISLDEQRVARTPKHPMWDSEADLTETIKEHWRKYRPSLYREAMRDGDLETLAQSRAQQTISLAESLTLCGIEASSAWSDAMREIALAL